MDQPNRHSGQLVLQEDLVMRYKLEGKRGVYWFNPEGPEVVVEYPDRRPPERVSPEEIPDPDDRAEVTRRFHELYGPAPADPQPPHTLLGRRASGR